MDDRAYLHTAEQLLASQKPSGAFLILSLLRGIVDAVILGLILCAVIAAIAFFGFDETLSWPWYATLFILSYAGIAWRRWTLWHHNAAFRITNERILIEYPTSLFAKEHRTIKWQQYQESLIGPRNPLDLFFSARSLRIYYGTPEGPNEVYFPSLHYCQDLKHYLDKVDSAVRRNATSELRPFVAKPKGARDV